MKKELEEKIFNNVRSFLRYSQIPFRREDLHMDSRFSKIEGDELDKIFLINESLDCFESIGMVDRIGHIYYSNN